MAEVPDNKFFSVPVKIKFNPDTVENDPVRRVFEDDLARTLWLGIKPMHLAGPEFDDCCLNAAEGLRNRGIPSSPEKLVNLLRNYFGHPPYSVDFATELLPYLSGKKLEYIVTV